MGAGKYLRSQFRVAHLALKHADASDFYLSCWQRNRAALPMFCARTTLFLGCVGIIISSLLLPERINNIAYWPIYATNWAITLVTVASGLAAVVSGIAYFKGPIECDLDMPWYVKFDWLVNLVAVPVAFNTTIFYYAFLFPYLPDDYEVNEVLDVFTHGVNSVVMVTLLMTSRHPVYLLQALYPVGFMLIYLVFSVSYYFAGGTNQLGERWVYPMLNWGEPTQALTTGVMVVALIAVYHAVSVLLTLMRDLLAGRCHADKNYYVTD